MEYSRSFWLRHRREVTHDYTKVDSARHAKKSFNFPAKILYLRDESGYIEEDADKVLERIAVYYSELYKSPPGVPPPPPEMTFGLQEISNEKVKDLEAPITLQELENALFSLNLGKSPGIDGITVEFYIKFWNSLGPLLWRWCTHIVEIGELSGTAAMGVITLINKKGDPRLLYNWRPITLISVDTKILCKALASRLMPAVTSVLPMYQSAVPGRSIHDSLAIIRDVVAFKKEIKEPLYVLALDQMKAFDKVNHNFLFHLLHKIGLPQYMIRAIKAIYTGYRCVVKNVDCLSKDFSYSRGIRQGDPTSTALYTLAIQPALVAIHLALYWEGVFLNLGDRILLSAYADDVTIFLHSDDSIPVVLAVFEEVGKFSEASINIYKSQLAGFNLSNSDKSRLLARNYLVPVTFEHIKILGIEFTESLKIFPGQWNAAIQSTRESVAKDVFMLKSLSYVQRAKWCSKKLWPRWAYLFKTLHPSPSQLAQLTVVLTEAVWLGGKHWLAAADLSAPVALGGLGLVSPADKVITYRTMMIARLLCMDKMSPVFKLAEKLLNFYNGADKGFAVLHTVPDKDELLRIPPVYSAAILAWHNLPISFFPSSREELLEMPVFWSKFLVQYDEDAIVTCSYAKSVGCFTIREFLQKVIPFTRYTHSILKSIQEAVDAWEYVPPPDIKEQLPSNDVEILCSHNSWRFPIFYLNTENHIVKMNDWKNKLVADLLLRLRTPNSGQHVSPRTWKILQSSEAPNTHKNQYWRFLHTKVPTPQFYCNLGVCQTSNCILCNSEDDSYVHQFSTCPTLQMAFHSLTADREALHLQPLLDCWQLYPFSSLSNKLANIICIAFVYSIILVTKRVANGSRVSANKFNDIFLDVIAKHVVCFARVNPPSCLDQRFRWLTLTHLDLVATFRDDFLYIRTSKGFKKYSENDQFCL